MTIELEVDGGRRVALVDDDFDHLRRYRWRLSPSGFVFRHGNSVIRLAHVVVGRPLPGFGVVWLNGDRLDNRRCNLRCLSTAEQGKRRGPRGQYRKTRERAAATLPLYQDDAA